MNDIETLLDELSAESSYIKTRILKASVTSAIESGLLAPTHSQSEFAENCKSIESILKAALEEAAK